MVAHNTYPFEKVNDNTIIYVGTASVVMTMPLGLPMGGYPIDRSASGTLDDLFVKALVFSNGHTTIALAVCDVCAISAEDVAVIRETVHGATSIPASNIMIGATHTHTGPLAAVLFGWESPDLEWLHNFRDEVASTVVAAWQNQRLVHLTALSGLSKSTIYNRRIVTNEGEVVLSSRAELNSDTVRGPEGPVDPEIGVLRITDVEGFLEAVLINFAAHTDYVAGNQYSADYPGWISSTVKSLLSKEVTVMFTMGAGGNLCGSDPVDFSFHASRRRTPFQDPQGPQKASQIGKKLGTKVVKVLEQAHHSSVACLSSDIGVLQEQIEMSIRQPTAAEVDLAGIVKQDPNKATLWDRVYASGIEWAENHAGELVILEVQVMTIGELAFVGLPVELFTEFGLEIKTGSPFKHTWIVSLANGYLGYIPTVQAFDNGGYEVITSHVSKLQPDAGPIITQTVLVILKQLYSNNRR